MIVGLSVFGIAGAAFFFAGAFLYSTSTVEAHNIVAPLNSPVLQRIADCESGNGKQGTATQFEHGQVLVRANKNGTTDMGKYQINSIWFKQASSLGFDLSTEDGNTAMAEWLYLNHGTEPWYASSKCWK